MLRDAFMKFHGVPTPLSWCFHEKVSWREVHESFMESWKPMEVFHGIPMGLSWTSLRHFLHKIMKVAMQKIMCIVGTSVRRTAACDDSTFLSIRNYYERK